MRLTVALFFPHIVALQWGLIFSEPQYHKVHAATNGIRKVHTATRSYRKDPIYDKTSFPLPVHGKVKLGLGKHVTM
jgi:hypothetical protein